MQVNIFQAKTELSKLIAALENNEEDEIVIARGGDPVAVLKRFQKTPNVKLGLFNGKYEVPDDIDECNDEILSLMEGGE